VEYDLSIWYQKTTDRILAWRELRKNVLGKSLEDMLKSINVWWSYTPIVKQTVDPYTPESWPTPWELINNGSFCRNAVALGQAYTLWICCPHVNTEIWFVNNFEDKELHLVTVVDSKTVLNYTFAQPELLDNCNFEVLEKITKDDLKHIKL
jgi:hypothetical protein